jgi:hypothetical protein
MSQHSGDFEDFLRGALHAAVDPAEPAGDGLERIRARLTTPHPLPVAWLMAVCSWVARYARGSLDSVVAWLRTVPIETHSRGGAAASDGPHMQRLRLVSTVAAVAILMAISVAAVTPFGQRVIEQAGSVLHSIGGGGNGSGSGGVPAGTAAPAPSGGGNGGAGVTAAGSDGQNQGQSAGSCVSSAPSLVVPSASPSAASVSRANPSTASPSPMPCASPAASPSPSPASPSPTSPSPTSPPPSSPPPSSPPPSSPLPSSPGPGSSSPSSPSPSSASTSPGSSGPASSSPSPASDPGPGATSAGPEDSASG